MLINLCQAQNSLVVKFNDGTENVTLLSSIKKITFSEVNLLLSKTETEIFSYPLQTISKLTFGAFSGIQAISDESFPKVYPNPAHNFFSVKNLLQDKNLVQIYSTNGRLLKSIMLVNETQQIDISMFENGFYFVKICGQTLKLIKQ